MKFIFIDEFKGDINKKLFGIVLIYMDCTKYDVIRKSFLKSLEKIGWDNEKELKGRYLFSNNAAEQKKTASEMIDLTLEIISWLSSDKLSRIKVFYSFNNKGATIDNFCDLSCKIINKIPKFRDRKSGKHLLSLYFDYFDSCLKIENRKKINKEIGEALEKRGHILTENHCLAVHSSNFTPGVIYADVCSYLCRWISENKDKKECNLLDLIEHSPAEKTQTVKNIYNQIKNIKKI